MIGKIKRVGLREVWKHEAYDFTQWLEENIEILNDVIDINLANAEREKSAGTFSVDLVAEDEKGNPVVIENQLEKSNHDHLGKLITYLTNLGSKVGIWVVSDPRPEHVNAISWLNESSSASFYLLKVEAIKIGDSEPAPLLTLIVGPSEESREVGQTKQKIAERHIFRQKWWTALLDQAKKKTRLHANISPSAYNWVGTSSGIRGLSFNYVVNQHNSAVELYIDKGKDSREINKEIFEKLIANKDRIEAAYGESLEWERLESKRACRIVRRFPNAGYRNPDEQWPQIHDEIINAMIRFEKALSPYLKKIKAPK
ncbi:MAG: DUF4268 domain-containing protein [candidate division Zixibacteria bacterium]|nr:DUF4268 domain-containing protein [candidate division Zixibacteria bacterium]